MMQTMIRPFPLEAVLGLLVSCLESPVNVDLEASARRFCELVQEELDRVVPSEARLIVMTDRIMAINIEDEQEILDYLRYAETAVSELGLSSYLVDCE